MYSNNIECTQTLCSVFQVKSKVKLVTQQPIYQVRWPEELQLALIPVTEIPAPNCPNSILIPAPTRPQLSTCVDADVLKTKIQTTVAREYKKSMHYFFY